VESAPVGLGYGHGVAYSTSQILRGDGWKRSDAQPVRVDTEIRHRIIRRIESSRGALAGQLDRHRRWSRRIECDFEVRPRRVGYLNREGIRNSRCASAVPVGRHRNIPLAAAGA